MASNARDALHAGITTTRSLGPSVEADGLYGFRRAARHQLELGADHIKIMISGGISGEFESIGSSQMARDEMEAVVLAAAEVVRAGERIGTLEPGKVADIVACDGNPALDIRALRGIRFVMQAGRVVRFDDRAN
jgi:imidazolonepropionase-like amidohydrolase